MSPPPAAAEEAGALLRRIESLLDQALDDLTGLDDLAGRVLSSPCSRCAATLAEAAAELQSFARLVTELQQEPGSRERPLLKELAALVPRVKALPPRLNRVERLLAAASAFYLGWCAAGPRPGYPAPGYAIDAWSPGPALLAFEG